MDTAYPLRLIPRDELAGRLARFQQRLQAAAIDVALVVHGVDLLYLSGTRQQAHLLVPPANEPRLLARKSASRAARESAWDTAPLRSLRDLPPAVTALTGHAPRRVGLELDVMPVTVFRQYEALWPDAEFVDVGAVLRELRATKTAWEVERVAEAGVMMDQILQAMPDVLREGMTEVELAGRLEAVGRRLGHQGVTPMRNWNMELHFGAVVSGPSGAAPVHFDGPLGGVGVSVAAPMSASYRSIRRGEPVVIDYIACVEGYLCDQTRVFSLGPLPQSLQDAHAAMREVYQVIAQACAPGITGGEVYSLAVAKAEEFGLGDVFMGPGEGKVSFVAHGVGLEVDELPLLARGYKGVLQPGMVLAVEPKAIFPGVGAVGIENTAVVTETGLRSLSVSPEEIVVL